MDTTLLQQLLIWVFSGGGAAAITYYLVEKVGFLANLESWPKRVAALVVAAVFGCGAYSLAILAGYVDTPATTLGWIEIMVAVAMTSSKLADLFHGYAKLR